MSDWQYDGEIPTDAYGFIYLIAIGGKEYIGKKNFFTKKKKWFGKKKLAEITDNRVKKYEYITKESNWKTYCSSSKIVELMVKEGFEPERKILKICYSAKELTYYENKFLYTFWEDDSNINDNISGKIFKNEVEQWKQ